MSDKMGVQLLVSIELHEQRNGKYLSLAVFSAGLEILVAISEDHGLQK